MNIYNKKLKIQKQKIIDVLKKEKHKRYKVYPKSFWQGNDLVFFLVKDSYNKYLGIYGNKTGIEESNFSDPVENYIELGNKSRYIILYQRNSNNLEKLKNIFPALTPLPLKKNTSFGFGDRLGLATPGHIRVIYNYKNILPVFAQQSVRELNNTNRDFKDVISDTTWNVFQEGYNRKWGADADHLKEKRYFTEAMDAGFTMYTVDTSDVLDERVLNMDTNRIKKLYDLKPNYLMDILNRYVGKKYKIANYIFNFDEDTVIRIALLYYRALDFVTEIYKLLKSNISNYDYEVSFDETNSVTSPEAHFFIANELHQQNINFDSLALRFPGIFEKGVDYIGKTQQFAYSIKINSEICRRIGGYKLSLHSGSDKFSIYSDFNKYTKGVFHIKTSGTSWLEALGVISACNPELFREIYKIAVDSFENNKKYYHLRLNYLDIPKSLDKFKDSELHDLIYDRKIRQTLHIAYGAILNQKKKEIYKLLFDNEDKHYKLVASYLKRHLEFLK